MFCWWQLINPGFGSRLSLRWLAESRTSVPLAENVPQVTCALYGRQLTVTGSGSLQDLVGPGDLVAEEEWREWREDGRSWFSVDRPTDLEAGLTRFGTPAHR